MRISNTLHPHQNHVWIDVGVRVIVMQGELAGNFQRVNLEERSRTPIDALRDENLGSIAQLNVLTRNRAVGSTSDPPLHGFFQESHHHGYPPGGTHRTQKVLHQSQLRFATKVHSIILIKPCSYHFTGGSEDAIALLLVQWRIFWESDTPLKLLKHYLGGGERLKRREKHPCQLFVGRMNIGIHGGRRRFCGEQFDQLVECGATHVVPTRLPSEQGRADQI
mmetsp:Transcript_47728/g.120156  ORF Transcript_47728/g.120156 Transcript_47728/m.120156 type:complete len:221 (-) Transcript_47728:313-975(-)